MKGNQSNNNLFLQRISFRRILLHYGSVLKLKLYINLLFFYLYILISAPPSIYTLIIIFWEHLRRYYEVLLKHMLGLELGLKRLQSHKTFLRGDENDNPILRARPNLKWPPDLSLFYVKDMSNLLNFLDGKLVFCVPNLLN